MIHDSLTRFRLKGPPKLDPVQQIAKDPVKPTDAGESSVEDRSEISESELDSQKKAAANPQKQDFFAVMGSLALLGLTGLGFVQGMAGPAQAAPQTEQVTEVEATERKDVRDLSVLTQIEETPEMVVAGRQGQLLGAGKILKFDQFPGLRRTHLKEQLKGAPNFRQVEGTNVYGVAQPTIEGLTNVLDRVGAKEQEVKWTNMREEPVVYINGRSHSLRTEAHPFENSADFKGASSETVEKTEQQLKAEVLAEAQANGGRILLHGENSDGTVVSDWVEVTPDSVKTTKEVYQDLQAQGYKIDYARNPVTDEKTPEAKDLQVLVDRVKGGEADTIHIFNCHAGRGRTTTAMVAAQLIQRSMNPDAAETPFHRLDSVREDIKEQGRYERGDYRLILSLIKNLDNGVSTKAETDAVVDQTEDMQNLRTDINKYRKKSLSADSESRAQRAEDKGLDYLKRYHTLITFNQYAKEQAPKGFELSFEEWLEQKPELTRMLENFELAMTTPASNMTGQNVQMA